MKKYNILLCGVPEKGVSCCYCGKEMKHQEDCYVEQKIDAKLFCEECYNKFKFVVKE